MTGDILFTWLLVVLIHAQGDDSFRRREAATAALRGALPHSAAVLAAGAKHPDAEIASRCGLLVDRWWQVESHRLAERVTGWGDYPWLDMMPADWQGDGRDVILRNYLERARDITPGWTTEKKWTVYRTATRLYYRDAIYYRRLTVAEVRKLCRQMREIERRYGSIGDNQH